MSALPHHVPLYDDAGEIPEAWRALAQAPIWVAWRWGKARPNGKRPKVPVAPATLREQGWNDPSAWAPYEIALLAAQANGLAGVGIVLRREDGIVALDLDGARYRGDDGKWRRKAWAGRVIGESPQSYCETSPSGMGYRILARGTIERDIAANESGLEAFGGSGVRFVTVTGRPIAGSPTGPLPAPETIRRALDHVKAAGGDKATDRLPSATKADGASQRGAAPPALGAADLTPMRLVNEIALARRDGWVPELFPDARRSANGAWRISSASLGRDLEEDISIAASGVQDFGEERALTPIDVVVEHLPADGPIAAAAWLLDRMGLASGFRMILAERGAAFAGRELRNVFDETTTHAAPEWPAGTLPPTIERRARDVAARVGCGPEAALAAHLAAIAGAAPASIRFDVFSDRSWYLMASWCAILVGDSGARKSPPIEAALQPLFDVETRWRRRWESAARAHRRRVAKREADREDAPKRKRRVVSDATTEVVVRILSANSDGLLVYCDEAAGFFAAMGRYANGAGGESADGAFWLSAIDARATFFDRVSDGISIALARPKLSFIGGIQRQPLAEIIARKAKSGLVQRFALVEMGPVRERIAAPPDDGAERLYRRAVEVLATFDIGEDDFVIVGEPAVGAMLKEFDGWAVAAANDQELAPALAAIASKSAAAVGRLALALHLADWAAGEAARWPEAPQPHEAFAGADDDDPLLALPPQRRPPPTTLRASVMRRAIEFYRRFVWANLVRIYGSGDPKAREDLQVAARFVLRLAREGRDSFRTREVYRAHERFADMDGRRRLSDILGELSDAAWIEKEPDGKRGEGWRINPEVAGLTIGRRAA